MSAGFMVTTSWPKSTMRMQPWCMIGEDCLFKPWMPGRRVSTGNTVLHSPKLPSCQMWSSISSAPGLWSRWRSASAMARRHRSWNPTWRTVRKQLPPWLRAGCGQMQPDLSGATRGQIWGVWGQQRVWTFQNPLRMFLGLLLLSPLETHFLPKLLDHSSFILSSLQSKQELFRQQIDRLKIVLEMKQKLADGLFEEVDINMEDADLYSDTTSMTGTTAMSGISGKKSNPGSLKTR